jgi:hypothetical protein
VVCVKALEMVAKEVAAKSSTRKAASVRRTTRNKGDRMEAELASTSTPTLVGHTSTDAQHAEMSRGVYACYHAHRLPLMPLSLQCQPLLRAIIVRVL